VKYAWIERHRLDYPVGLMCELLSVSRIGLHAARVRAPPHGLYFQVNYTCKGKSSSKFVKKKRLA